MSNIEKAALNITKPSVPIIRMKMIKEGGNQYSKKQITSPTKASKILKDFFDGLDREAMFVLCLSNSKNPVGINLVSVGKINAAFVSPREVYKPAILSNSNSIIIAHNHPSGNLEASRADIELTKTIYNSGQMLGIQLNDHLIFSPDGDFISMSVTNPDLF